MPPSISISKIDLYPIRLIKQIFKLCRLSRHIVVQYKQDKINRTMAKQNPICCIITTIKMMIRYIK